MIRVPSVNPSSRDARIARLEARLAELRAISPDQRHAEFVPEKESTILELIEALKGSPTQDS